MKKIILITIEKLLEMKVNSEKFKLVEVLSEESYNEGHIPGAINIPLDELVSLGNKFLEKNDVIVVYCGSYRCQRSTKAAIILLELGYENTLEFKAGKRGWVHSGLKLEK